MNKFTTIILPTSYDALILILTKLSKYCVRFQKKVKKALGILLAMMKFIVCSISKDPLPSQFVN